MTSLIGRIERAPLDIINHVCVGVKAEEHLALKLQTFFFRFNSGPVVRFRLGAMTIIFRVEVKLGVVGIMGDGAGVPQRRMPPGRSADDESRLGLPCLHAAPASLPDYRDIFLDDGKFWQRPQQGERLSCARDEFTSTANFYGAYCLRGKATEEHRSDAGLKQI